MAAIHRVATRSEQQLATASLLLSNYFDSIRSLCDQVLDTSADADLAVLLHLHSSPAQRPRELMDVTGLSRPGAAAIVARLEALGLVQRSFGVDDRRNTLASLTALGRRRLATLARRLEDHFVSSGPLVAEVLDLLGCTEHQPDSGTLDSSPIEWLARLGAARLVYLSRLDGALQELPRRNRVAISALMSWGLARPTRLAEALRLSSGGLTYVTDHLEADGIVTRTYGQGDDRRAVSIQLSERGVAHGRVLCGALAASAEELCPLLRRTLVAG